MKYKLLEKNNFFISERDKAAILLIRETSEQFILNDSGLFIFQEALKQSDSEIVLKKVVQKYKNVDLEILKSDVKNILRMMKIYSIISYDDMYDMVDKSNSRVGCIEEDEYAVIGNFIENNQCAENLLIGIKGYYSPANIRAHVMNNQEYYYGIKKDDNSYLAAMVVIPNLEKSSVVNITTLVFDKKLNKKDAVVNGKEMIEYVRNSMINEITKFRVSFYAMPDEMPIYVELLEKIGFKLEVELKNENGKQSMFLYTLKLS